MPLRLATRKPALEPEVLDEMPLHLRARRSLRHDTGGNISVAGAGGAVLSLVIAAVLVGFFGLLLFNSLAPDVTTICDGVANGTYTQADCDTAEDTRNLILTAILVGVVAIIMAMLAVVGGIAKQFSGRN